MKKIVCHFFILISAVNATCFARINELQTDQDIAQIDELVEKCLKTMNVPGASVGIIIKDKVALAKGYGLSNIEKVLPVTSQTRFPIGSITKPFTSFLVGQLIQDGLLNWDHAISDYVPHFRLDDPYTTYDLTFRDALTHTWGYPKHDAVWFNRGLTRAQLVQKLRYLEPCYSLREYFLYQNLSYTLVGHAIECITEKSWEDLMREKILLPLQMKETGFDVTQLPNCKDFAIGYREKNKEIFSVDTIDATTIGPAGSMNSTVDDLNKWVTTILRNDESLIDSSIWEEITTPQVVSNVVCNPQYNLQEIISMESYAMGWFIISYRGHKVVFHGGNITGFSSSVLLIPSEGIGIVVLTNKDYTPMPYLLSTILIDKILGLEPVDWIHKYKSFTDYSADSASKEQTSKNSQRHENTEPSHPIHEYAGMYEHPAYGNIEVVANKTILEATLNGIKLPLNHWHYDVFEIGEGADIVGLNGRKILFRENVYGDIHEIQIPLELKVSDALFTRKKDLRLFDRDYLDKFIGDYSYHGFGFLIKREEDKLIVLAAGRAPLNLFPEKDNLFKVEAFDGYTVQFISNDSGMITAVQLIQPNKSIYTAYRY